MTLPVLYSQEFTKALKMAASKVKLSTDHVLKGLDQLRNEALLCDVHLVAEGAKYPAHRVVLAAASTYFQAMFTGGFKESQMSEITLNDTSSEGLKCILDTIYTGELSLSVENVCDVLPVASQLQLNEIVKHCKTFLVNNISTHNCLTFLSVAEKYDLREAVDVCNEFALENFATISLSMEFTNLSKAQLCNYISDDHLKTSHGEIDVFKAILKWFEVNQSSNTGVPVELMQHVRFPLIPSNILLDEVLTNGLISENSQVMMMVREALRFHSAENLFLQPQKKGKQFQPRGELTLVVISSEKINKKPTVMRETKIRILNATGHEPFHTLISEQVLPRAFYSRSISVVTQGNYLFIFGSDAEYIRPIAVRFDVKTNTWLDLKPPPYDATTYTPATLLKGKIYLLGGMHVIKGSVNPLDASNPSACASQYSIETNSWLKLQNLPKPLARHSAASYENYVFCAGGINVDKHHTNTLHAYDVVGKIWLSKAPMNYERATFSLEALRAKLVACGGVRSPNVEIYNIADDQWTLIQDGVLEHHVSRATVTLNDKVYVIGGSVRDEGSTLSKTNYVSCVDVDNGTISRVSSLPFPVANHVCTLLTVPNTTR